MNDYGFKLKEFLNRMVFKYVKTISPTSSKNYICLFSAAAA